MTKEDTTKTMEGDVEGSYPNDKWNKSDDNNNDGAASPVGKVSHNNNENPECGWWPTYKSVASFHTIFSVVSFWATMSMFSVMSFMSFGSIVSAGGDTWIRKCISSLCVAKISSVVVYFCCCFPPTGILVECLFLCTLARFLELISGMD
jgi:hypothetical protein